MIGPRLGTPQDWNSSSINGMITTQSLGGGSTDHSVRAGGQFSALPGLSAKSRDMVWVGLIMAVASSSVRVISRQLDHIGDTFDWTPTECHKHRRLFPAKVPETLSIVHRR